MLMRIIVCSFIIITCDGLKSMPQNCLIGHMTELQSWVDAVGALNVIEEHKSTIDLSTNLNPVPELRQRLKLRPVEEPRIKYLSMAHCKLNRVPQVFRFKDASDKSLSDTLEYITFFGNDFADGPRDMYDFTINGTESREGPTNELSKQKAITWSQGFQDITFTKLKELDLRACRIEILSNNTFKGMPNLQSLYIGENKIVFIETNAFAGLINLKHLDLNKNIAYDNRGNIKPVITETLDVLEPLIKLISFDMSYIKLSQRHINILKSLGPTLKSLSLCETGITNLGDETFIKTSLEILDVSGNGGILTNKTLNGLEDTLKVLYAREIGLRTMYMFEGFKKLEILDVSNNEIAAIVDADFLKTLHSLKVLNLEKNRLSSWFSLTYSYIPTLELLNLKDNNINIITEEMIEDIANIHYLAMSGNFIICNCHCKNFINIALRNEKHNKIKNETFDVTTHGTKFESYHRGYIDYNRMIARRKVVSFECKDCNYDDADGNFVLLDYGDRVYSCLIASDSKPVEFYDMPNCKDVNRKVIDNAMRRNEKRLVVLLMLPFLLLILIAVFIFRRNCRYFLITVKNSATLSLIHKHEVIDDTSIFHYDVFVSYCNEDRAWVLDKLLPNLEQDCSFSACLHERDFQVGHSILENIVSSMDRSRSIMLIISQEFLLSQWCQFEMHLAQHRLLETRREDLTLVLLEEIPRRLRPNTLHYLMLTKTYIVWPQAGSEQALFWRRLKKALLTVSQRTLEKDSSA